MACQIFAMKRYLLLFTLLWATFVHAQQKLLQQTIVLPANASVRVKYGASRLQQVLDNYGYSAELRSSGTAISMSSAFILADVSSSSKDIPDALVKKTLEQGNEGFLLFAKNGINYILGADASGVLYGCLEMANQIENFKKIPSGLDLSDHPQMVLRGTCVGLQKPDYLPGRDVYEYPYTPESFPWFYDKQLWVKYLDMMVENRYNSLYLWNGHPFSSLVKLKDYPYAVEVDDETFKKNEEMFRFLTEEADKRGIWVIQMFYNIIIPKPFAEKHGLKTQDRNRPINPLIADYTRKSIAAFVQKYPNVGLLITLGEAMEGTGQDDVDWFCKTIIPGVKDGLKLSGVKQQPPIVLRAHDTDAPRVMASALPIYKNLYTMAKFNGEALTTYAPRGSWADLHRKLSSIGTVHIENVHILANLEPFRYGSADFIQKSVQAMHSVYGANGLHLYPQASYWDWPYTADKADPRLKQLDRDWIWYAEWARYAWKADRDRNEEIDYWADRLAKQYGTDLSGGKSILKAYEESGEISPKLLRRYGITDGNRQTLTLGMLMTQLINPFRYGLFTMLYESEAPEGEMIIEYAEKEWKKQNHIGETPVQIAKEVVDHGKQAVLAIDAVKATKNTDEFKRLRNDMYCQDAMANFYADKVKAALWILRFKYSNQVADLEKALPFLESSVAHYTKLATLTGDTYLYANSMQTKQRKIPMRGVDKTFIHWKEMVPVFQNELTHFKHSLDSLKALKPGQIEEVVAFKNAKVKLLNGLQTYRLEKGASVFSDTLGSLAAVADKLVGLNAIKLNKSAYKNGTSITFYAKEPVKVLVGYFSGKEAGVLLPPTLETDASANDYGQAEIKISNALVVNGLSPVNVHTYTFPAGKNTLTLGKGYCLILGFVADEDEFKIFNAGLDGRGRDIDWLFE